MAAVCDMREYVSVTYQYFDLFKLQRGQEIAFTPTSSPVKQTKLKE